MSAGGKRPGAGRPRLGDGKKVGVSFSVSQDVQRKLRELRKAGVAVNDMIADYIRVLHCDNLGFQK